MNIIETSLKYRQVTLSVLAVLFIFGVYSLVRMPRREDPKNLHTAGIGRGLLSRRSSEEVEQQVTKHIEEFLFKFEEIKKSHTTSASQDGKSVITVELNENVEDYDLFWNKLRNELLVMKQQKTSVKRGRACRKLGVRRHGSPDYRSVGQRCPV